MTFSPYYPEIRFADIDAMGHVNNAVYFSYFEQARMHFFGQMIAGKWDWKEHGILVAHNEIDYKAPVFLRDRIRINVGCTHIGNRSFTLSYVLYREKEGGDEVCSVGASVLVCFDHVHQRSRTIPEDWIPMLQALLTSPQ